MDKARGGAEGVGSGRSSARSPFGPVYGRVDSLLVGAADGAEAAMRALAACVMTGGRGGGCCDATSVTGDPLRTVLGVDAGAPPPAAAEAEATHTDTDTAVYGHTQWENTPFDNEEEDALAGAGTRRRGSKMPTGCFESVENISYGAVFADRPSRQPRGGKEKVKEAERRRAAAAAAAQPPCITADDFDVQLTVDIKPRKEGTGCQCCTAASGTAANAALVPNELHLNGRLVWQCGAEPQGTLTQTQLQQTDDGAQRQPTADGGGQRQTTAGPHLSPDADQLHMGQ